MRIATGETNSWLLTHGSATRVPAWAMTRSGALRRPVRGVLNLLERVEPRPAPPYQLTVLTTTNCNLGCDYCFQNVAPAEAGSFKPLRIGASTLTGDRIADIAAFTGRRMADGGYPCLDLLVFGGEPLLNPGRVVDLLSALKAYGLVRAHMVSNAVRLDLATARRLERAGLSEVQVTFDGARGDHDQVRHDHRGRGTYDTIVTNVAQAIDETGLKFSLRVNVTAGNAAGIEVLVDDLAAKLDPARCSMHFALVDATQAGFHATVTHEQLQTAYVGWHLRALAAGFDVDVPSGSAECRYCDHTRGRDGAVVGADGVLYSCWDSAGQRGFDVGTAADGYYADDRVEDRWVSCGYQSTSATADEPQESSLRQQRIEQLKDAATVAVLDWHLQPPASLVAAVDAGAGRAAASGMVAVQSQGSAPISSGTT
jgi:uncharacterized protein